MKIILIFTVHFEFSINGFIKCPYILFFIIFKVKVLADPCKYIFGVWKYPNTPIPTVIPTHRRLRHCEEPLIANHVNKDTQKKPLE